MSSNTIYIKAEKIGHLHGEIKFKTSIGTGICSQADIVGSVEMTNDTAQAVIKHFALSAEQQESLDHLAAHLHKESVAALKSKSDSTDARMREAAIVECAEIAKALTKKWGNPDGTDYQQGMQDQGVRIISNIEALASAPPAKPVSVETIAREEEGK